MSPWRLVFRPLLFRIDAERAHHLSTWALRIACVLPGFRALLAWLTRVDEPALRTKLFGLDVPGPIGLAAGFDKDARFFRDLDALGFGVLEVGTLTAQAQPGNPKPRVFRLFRDRALLNRFGFNNAGAAAAANRIARTQRLHPLGVNIGKTKVVANEDAPRDYLASFDAIAPHADYVVVNVSSPNTPGLRALQDRDALHALLSALQQRNRALAKPRPLLVKIAPDLTDEQLDDVVALALELQLDGLIATNTTLSRDGLATPPDEVQALGAGGVSGAPLTLRSREVVARLARRAAGRLVIIGAGGVMGADDAWELLRAGASLVQVYTGLIYGGPFFVRDLHRELARRLRERGLSSVSDVVGEALRPKN